MIRQKSAISELDSDDRHEANHIMKKEAEAMSSSTEERKAGISEGSREFSRGAMNIRNHVYPFIFFIDNSSHICHAAPMVNFNFLAQLIIITILYSFRYSQQDKSPNST